MSVWRPFTLVRNNNSMDLKWMIVFLLIGWTVAPTHPFSQERKLHEYKHSVNFASFKLCLWALVIVCFHTRQACVIAETMEHFSITKKLILKGIFQPTNMAAISIIAVNHQHGRRDVMWKHYWSIEIIHAQVVVDQVVATLCCEQRLINIVIIAEHLCSSDKS